MADQIKIKQHHHDSIVIDNREKKTILINFDETIAIVGGAKVEANTVIVERKVLKKLITELSKIYTQQQNVAE